MADPYAVQAILQELGVSPRDPVIPNAIAIALDAGFTGPTIVQVISENMASGGPIGALRAINQLVIAKGQNEAAASQAQTDAANQAAGRQAAGFAPIQPQAVVAQQPGFSTTGPVGPAGMTGPSGETLGYNPDGPERRPDRRVPEGYSKVSDRPDGGFVALDPKGSYVLFDANGQLLDTRYDPSAAAAAGGRGFAPQAKSTGTLPNGVPYIIDPNQAPGSQAYNALTGAPLSAQDFAQLPKQMTSDWGTLLMIGADGTVTDTGQKVGFARLTPQQEQQNAVDLANLRESGANQRNVANETGANQRAELQARTTGFTTAANLVPTLGNLALQQADFNRQVTANPSDFVARAFASRGEKSPFGFVSQADIMNQLSSAIQGYNQSLAQFGTFNPAVNTSIGAPAQTQQAGFTPPVQQTAVTQTPSIDQQRAEANQRMKDAGVPSWVPGFANGTIDLSQYGALIADPQVVVGIRPDGSAIYANRSQTTGVGDQNGYYQLIGGPAFGTPGFSNPLAAPQIPNAPTVTQQQLQDAERQARPPAINRLLNNQPVGDLKFGFNLPSAMGLNSLTPDEKTAFGTTLATQYNTSLQDVEKAVNDRYGFAPSRQAVARFAAGTMPGFTTEPMFLGNEKGAELFINPTNAPIAVVNHEDTKQMGFKMPGHADGTMEQPTAAALQVYLTQMERAGRLQEAYDVLAKGGLTPQMPEQAPMQQQYGFAPPQMSQTGAVAGGQMPPQYGQWEDSTAFPTMQPPMTDGSVGPQGPVASQKPKVAPVKQSPMIIQDNIGRLQPQQLERYLKSLSPDEYEAWAKSSERARAGEPWGNTIVAAVAGLAAAGLIARTTAQEIATAAPEEMKRLTTTLFRQLRAGPDQKVLPGGPTGVRPAPYRRITLEEPGTPITAPNTSMVVR